MMANLTQEATIGLLRIVMAVFFFHQPYFHPLG